MRPRFISYRNPCKDSLALRVWSGKICTGGKARSSNCVAIVLVEELVAVMTDKSFAQAHYLVRHALKNIGTATSARQRDWGIRQQGNENGCGGGIQLSWLLSMDLCPVVPVRRERSATLKQ
jgi:hypothetical protein